MKLTDLFEAEKPRKQQKPSSRTRQQTDFKPEFDFDVNMEPKQDHLPSDAPKEKKTSDKKAKPRRTIDPINIQGAPSINFDLLPDDEVSDDELEQLLNDIRNNTSTEAPRPTKSKTDLAVINKDIYAKKASGSGKDVGDTSKVNPNFLTISELPGYMVNGIRSLGRSVFNLCTNTRLEDIEIIANVQGQGPNTDRDINAIVNWVHSNAPEHEQLSANASINFGRVIPGYQPEVRGYTSEDHTYLLVNDPYGRYVFRWPVEDTKETAHQKYKENQMKLTDLYEQEEMTAKQAYDLLRSKQQRIPELERIVAQDAVQSYNYAKNVIKGRFPEGEPVIVNDDYYAFNYAKDVIKGRFPEAEPTIARTEYNYQYNYAKNIIKGRFPEGEPAIARNAHNAYDYAKNIIKGRFPEGEPAIATNAQCAYGYAKNIIKGRFPMGEETINNTYTTREKYISFLKSKNIELPPIFKTERELPDDKALYIKKGKGVYKITDVTSSITYDQFEKLIKLSFPSIRPHHLQYWMSLKRTPQQIRNMQIKEITWMKFVNRFKHQTIPLFGDDFT